MNQRYAYMKTMKDPKYEPGKNYAYYGLPPHFIFLMNGQLFMVRWIWKREIESIN